MPSVFTRIIDGELPGTFVWRDPEVVAFLSINPVVTGHALVVPRAEVDHWIDLDADLLAHVMHVAQTVARAEQQVYQPHKVGLLIAGLEVPHVHIHVIPLVHGESDLHLSHAHDASAEELSEAAERIRGALRDLGAEGASD